MGRRCCLIPHNFEINLLLLVIIVGGVWFKLLIKIVNGMTLVPWQIFVMSANLRFHIFFCKKHFQKPHYTAHYFFCSGFAVPILMPTEMNSRFSLAIALSSCPQGIMKQSNQIHSDLPFSHRYVTANKDKSSNSQKKYCV